MATEKEVKTEAAPAAPARSPKPAAPSPKAGAKEDTVKADAEKAVEVKEKTKEVSKDQLQDLKAPEGFRTHGRTFTGIVVGDKMHRTVTVQWERRHFVPKYQRYERRYTKVKAHNPDEIDAKKGDTVTIMETRPISKTKSFVVIKKH
jgi:ribosomal protein uS17